MILRQGFAFPGGAAQLRAKVDRFESNHNGT